MSSDILNKTREILVIDDDILILKSIEKQLRNDILHVELVDDPLEGLKRIDNKKYDLILCDVKMKPILGTEVLKEIKSKHPNLPVVILTGYVDDRIMEEVKQLGGNDFLIKPVRKSQLIECISNILHITF